MRRIYHQRKRGYDSAVRSQALKYLLQSTLTQDDVTELLTSVVGDPDAGELQTYVLARLWTESETDPELRAKVETALKDPRFHNWDLMAPGGKALAFKENMAGWSAFMHLNFSCYPSAKILSMMQDILQEEHSLLTDPLIVL